MLKLETTQDTLKFVAFLEEALPFVDYMTPTDINAGGCGVFALSLYEVLSKNGIKSEIYAVFFSKQHDDCRTDLEHFIKSNRTEDLHVAGADHIIVRVGDLFFDSTGIVSKAFLSATYNYELSIDQLKTLVDFGQWNEVFDRTTIPIINNNLNEVFDNYDKYELGCLINQKLLSTKVQFTPQTVKKMKEQRKDSLMERFFSFHNNI